MKARLISTVLLICMICAVQAQEAKVVLRSTVIGNQEQPKVLYIVPWQQADMPELSYRPLQNLVDNVYEQLDRDEFLRELNYREKINSSLTVSTPSN